MFSLYSIVFIVLGLYFLITPQEKLRAKFPKAKSVTILRVTGGFVLVIGIFLVVLGIATLSL